MTDRRPARPLGDHVESLKKAVSAQRAVIDLLRDITPGKWQSDSDRVVCGKAVICYVQPHDGAFIAGARNHLPDLLADMARMRRIEGAARELMAFLYDGADPDLKRSHVRIMAISARSADAIRERLIEMDAALGDGPAEMYGG